MNQPAASFEKQTGSLPADLVGRWTDGTFLYEFKDNGDYLLGSAGSPYTISPDGQHVAFCGHAGAIDDPTGLYLRSVDERHAAGYFRGGKFEPLFGVRVARDLD